MSEEKKRNPVVCLRCDVVLEYGGPREFARAYVYFCPRCGRIEFFINGIGEELRPH